MFHSMSAPRGKLNRMKACTPKQVIIPNHLNPTKGLLSPGHNAINGPDTSAMMPKIASLTAKEEGRKSPASIFRNMLLRTDDGMSRPFPTICAVIPPSQKQGPNFANPDQNSCATWTIWQAGMNTLGSVEYAIHTSSG
eukprot:gnl/MRDRNA2_/MRDRNA2_69336_c0_seq1.p2 gnl/MRDRNA2_/MRDRNA2_69336_c0~~gnl/MRDRNA2_/MRDRNA2_69336_c0_seq1.p2  ORF type:complete len:138 (-),score=11.89 gnl/MRDRNA2_/MRDRNA2_69336_c0_seq1:76-489(-)